MEDKDRIAKHKVTEEEGGNRFQFFCELSGAHAGTTKIIPGPVTEETLRMAWETEGRFLLNYCHQCGKWVSDAMYNADVLECVECTPWEDTPKYCPK